MKTAKLKKNIHQYSEEEELTFDNHVLWDKLKGSLFSVTLKGHVNPQNLFFC